MISLSMRSFAVPLFLLGFLLQDTLCSSDFETCDSGTFISDYHFPMVADDVRNNMFYNALKKAIIPNVSRVIDVGAGTMLLSMISMDLGAAAVLGVEENHNMASIAKEVLRVNNFTNNSNKGKILLFEGSFENLFLGHKKLKKPATIFVSETFDAALIGEKFLSILTHAKKEKIITADATVIPNSAVIFGQLLESTLSLRRDANNTPLLNLGKYNLEPMRKYRPSSVYTVRYLNEQNAVRRRLSDIVPLFEYDFQNYDLSSENFAYTCVIFKISEADEGVFDSIGLWFNLYLDKERELVLSNAPVSPDRTIHLAPCWMQAIYRVSKDVIVKRGDIVRIQIFQMPHNYVIGEVGNGLHNMNSRLIKLNAKNCRNAVEIYSFREDVYSEIQDPSFFQSNIYKNREYYVGAIPGGSKPGEETFAVFPAKVYQSFKIVAKLPSGKIMGMYYQLPDSQASLKASIRVKANTKLALDTYRITCPDE